MDIDYSAVGTDSTFGDIDLRLAVVDWTAADIGLIVGAFGSIVAGTGWTSEDTDWRLAVVG